MESYRGVSIVYDDNHLLVVVKPPNMPTQADDSGDADLHSTMKAYIAETYQKPGLRRFYFRNHFKPYGFSRFISFLQLSLILCHLA